MNYTDAIDHSPTRDEATRELAAHGHADWSEFNSYCRDYGLTWSDPGVLLGFLGY